MTLLAVVVPRVRAEFEWLFWSMTILCTLVAVGIALFLIYCAWRYRRRDDNELPSQNAMNIPAEVTWIGLPFLFFMAMFVYGTKLYFDIERPPASAEDVYVVAKQWMWKVQHAGGEREINALHVPAGRPIRLRMISQDAIHSFFVPEFRIKQDVLPQRYTTIWFSAERPGTFHLFCAEYCGTNHSHMGGWIYVMKPEDYQQWLQAGGAEGSLASTGEKLFHQHGCSNCHQYNGHGRAPSLVGLYGQQVQINGGSVVADEDYIRDSILNPKGKIAYGFQDIMPTFQGQLSEEDIIALIAYIKSLRGGEPSQRQTDAPPVTETDSNAPAKNNSAGRSTR